jgi:phage baseplate assembly protein W
VATIKIESVAQLEKAQSNFTYTDLKLDLEFDYTKNNELLKRKEIKDIKIDYDYAAIRNSIFNLLNTVPGQRILNPYFGVNLQKYLFNRVTEIQAMNIGNDIVQAISKFEPRVVVQNVNVEVDEVNQQYNILLTLGLVGIDSTSSFRLVGTLSNSGLFFN